MNPDKQSIRQVREIFDKARMIPVHDERILFLQEACGENKKLRREVDSLLAALETTRDFLHYDASGKVLVDCPDMVGTTVGQYHILELLGGGGFGNVYRAEQLEPFRREVAFKIVKLGMDTKDVLIRFEAERQALARMDHPNIAQVYDAGVTENGRPYFVMELVNGTPLIEYCNRYKLRLNERLQLFQQVCAGVQHAHQKGILHRDLKPSNVLVSSDDDFTLVKVIDFGVAKFLQGNRTDQKTATIAEMVVGTPVYMSPEQLSGNTGDIDTRSDIYSLGVILYELLAGVTPLDDQKYCPASLGEMARSLLDRDVPRPSKWLHSNPGYAQESALHRQEKPQGLIRLLHRDLDWVVMKAMERNRERRYGDVGHLARDIDHYLNHEPVSAGPPGVCYKTRKLVHRHRFGLVVSTSIGLIMMLGGWMLWIVLLRAVHEAERARINEVLAQSATERAHQQELLATEASERALKQAKLAEESRLEATRQSERAVQEAQRAAQEARRAEDKQALADATFGFLTDELFLRADSGDDPNGEVTLTEVIDLAAEHLEFYFTEQPVEKGRIHQLLAILYLRLASYDKARFHADEAVRLISSELGQEDPKTLSCRQIQAETMCHQGQLEEAEELLRKTLDVQERSMESGHPDTLKTLSVLASVLRAEKKYVEADELERRIDALHEKSPVRPDDEAKQDTVNQQ